MRVAVAYRRCSSTLPRRPASPVNEHQSTQSKTATPVRVFVFLLPYPVTLFVPASHNYSTDSVFCPYLRKGVAAPFARSGRRGRDPFVKLRTGLASLACDPRVWRPVRSAPIQDEDWEAPPGLK